MGFTTVLMAIAGLLCLVSWIWLLVAAFRVSLVWGMVLLLLAWTLIPVIVFAVRYWDEAKLPLALYGAGISLAAAAYVAAFMTLGRELDRSIETTGRAATADDESLLPRPRPTSLPTHASWEAVVDEIDETTDATWQSLVPSPTPVAGGLEWDELGSLVDHKLTVELKNGTVTTAVLEAVEPHRMRVRHVIGGGEAAYWIERDQITRVRPTY
jgi:hypothetical protein